MAPGVREFLGGAVLFAGFGVLSYATFRSVPETVTIAESVRVSSPRGCQTPVLVNNAPSHFLIVVESEERAAPLRSPRGNFDGVVLEVVLVNDPASAASFREALEFASAGCGGGPCSTVRVIDLR